MSRHVMACMAVVGATSAAGCRFELQRDLAPGELRGTVVTDDAVDGQVKRVAAAGAEIRVTGSTLATKVDREGRFVFRRMGAGVYGLSIRWDADGDGRPEALLGVKNVDIVPMESGAHKGQPGARDLGTLLLVDSGEVGGRVMLAGAPVADASLVVLDESGVPDANLPSARSDGQGRYRLPFVRSGQVVVKAVFTQNGDHVVAAVSDALTVQPRASVSADLVLQPPRDAQSGSVSGRIAAFDGVDSATVSLVREGAPPLSRDVSESDLFAIASVPPGTYTLVATAPGYMDVAVPELVVEGDVDAGTILFSQASVETGQDCNGDGVPACGPDDSADCDPDDDSDGIPDSDEDQQCRCRPGQRPMERNPENPDGPVVCAALPPCETARPTCDPNAFCEDVLGRAQCVCLPGFQGDGRSCRPQACPTGTECPEGFECANGLCGKQVDIEVAGTWLDPYESPPLVITNTAWGTSSMSRYDNTARFAITQSPADDPYTANKWARQAWTRPVENVWYLCTVDYGLDTEEAAVNTTKTADPSSPDTGGCGAFPWSRMRRQ